MTWFWGREKRKSDDEVESLERENQTLREMLRKERQNLKLDLLAETIRRDDNG